MPRIVIDLPSREYKLLERVAAEMRTPIGDFVARAASTAAVKLEAKNGVSTTLQRAACHQCGRELRGRQRRGCTEACKKKYRRKHEARLSLPR
jgi:hypothetical protein